ncbi:Gfo/Idh/MocA family oxidoreductase [Antribacter gilvus]|uniref:Gfo/Idh/MocA family oxidoreductase n=1 Tax=Antribacter gilvus TaxID=2304675 RepID=UPI000F783C86|nr:Gfo/Idh/MocA family oxidoreductase [Antribacter gilvus]
MTLRMAIVGYGGAGRQIHARLAREAGMSVTAVVTRDPGRRVQAAGDWPGARLHPDLTSLLADPSAYDLVVIASPSGSHAEHAAQVAASGVPFVLDKPIATTAAEARRVVSAAASTGTPFTVFQNRRWDPEQLTLVGLLRRGELGDVHTFERHWERWRPRPQQRWKENDLSGGGLLLDLGPHLVDSATRLFGRVQSVSAELRALSTPTEDDVFLVLHHAPGGGVAASPQAVVSRLWAGSLVGAPGPRTRVLGSGGAYLVTSFEADASPFEVLDETAPEGTHGWLTRGRERTPVPAAPGSHADFYRAVEEWLTGDGQIPVEPADAVRTAEVLDAARVSAKEGRTVPV